MDPSHIMFGSDFPFSSEFFVGKEIHYINELNILDDKIKIVIQRNNALELFPKYKTQDEKSYEEIMKKDFQERMIVKILSKILSNIKKSHQFKY